MVKRGLIGAAAGAIGDSEVTRVLVFLVFGFLLAKPHANGSQIRYQNPYSCLRHLSSEYRNAIG